VEITQLLLQLHVETTQQVTAEKNAHQHLHLFHHLHQEHNQHHVIAKLKQYSNVDLEELLD
jgi:hypothetical protein